MKKKLPGTLAGRIQHLRESSNLSPGELAARSNIDISIVTDIEEGKEIFLSAGIRQRIAKALRIPAAVLKEVELNPPKEEPPAETVTAIKMNILSGRLNDNHCPKCGNLLNCKIVTMYDLEDIPVKHPKARCSKCPFQIK
jgi:transcriptional regulator with XRE-family HTH domain